MQGKRSRRHSNCNPSGAPRPFSSIHSTKVLGSKPLPLAMGVLAGAIMSLPAISLAKDRPQAVLFSPVHVPDGKHGSGGIAWPTRRKNHSLKGTSKGLEVTSCG